MNPDGKAAINYPVFLPFIFYSNAANQGRRSRTLHLLVLHFIPETNRGP
jgi:hypothetical protein